tara:strand:- start:249 stop:638 length:390 start_codon:yes stop_codon:yes gene_type:complete
MSNTLTGECLCGAVSWKMHGPFEFFGMCQCSRCRKVTGAAFATNLFVKPDQFFWQSGENNRNEYLLSPPNTFGNACCKTCGSRVPRKTARSLILIPLGSTMELPDIEPTLVCSEDHTAWFDGLKSIIKS